MAGTRLRSNGSILGGAGWGWGCGWGKDLACLSHWQGLWGPALLLSPVSLPTQRALMHARLGWGRVDCAKVTCLHPAGQAAWAPGPPWALCSPTCPRIDPNCPPQGFSPSHTFLGGPRGECHPAAAPSASVPPAVVPRCPGPFPPSTTGLG